MSNRLNHIVFLLSLPFLFLFGKLSLSTSITDSEIWAINVSQMPFELDTPFTNLLFKPIFHGALKLGYLLGFENFDLYLVNRVLFCCFAFLALILVHRLANLIFKDKKLALLAVFVTLVNGLFIVRGFRVRSDQFAILIHLFASLEILRLYNRSLLNQTKKLTGVLLLSLVTLLITPKALFLVAANYIFACNLDKSFNEKFGFSKLRFLVKKITPLQILFFAIAFLFLLKLYMPAVIYFLGTLFSTKSDTVGYMSGPSFFYYLKFVENNALYSLLLLLFLADRKWIKNQSPILKAFYSKTLFLVGVLLLFPDKLPFFLCSYLPILSIGVTTSLERILSGAAIFCRSKNIKLVFVQIALVLFFCYSTLKMAGLNFSRNSNLNQIQFVENLESYVDQFPKTLFFDALGVLPSSNQIIRYLGYGESRLMNYLYEELKSLRPDFILRTSRMTYFGLWLDDLLDEYYVHLGNDLWGKSVQFQVSDSGESEIVDKWEHRYFSGAKLQKSDFYEISTDEILENLRMTYSINNMKDSKVYFYRSKGSQLPTKLARLKTKNSLIDLEQGISLSELAKSESLVVPRFLQSIKISVYPEMDYKAKKAPFQLFKFDHYF